MQSRPVSRLFSRRRGRRGQHRTLLEKFLPGVADALALVFVVLAVVVHVKALKQLLATLLEMVASLLAGFPCGGAFLDVKFAIMVRVESLQHLFAERMMLAFGLRWRCASGRFSLGKS